MRPSKRRHRTSWEVEILLIPVLSLLVVLVPMLLQTAVFEKTASIAMNLPSADDVKYLEELRPEDVAESLTLAMTDEGMILASGEDVLARIPHTEEGTFDYGVLEDALARAKARYPTQDDLVLLVEDAILYQEIVEAMDRARPYFPSVSMADRLVIGAEE